MANCARITARDILATNGIVHVVDKVTVFIFVVVISVIFVVAIIMFLSWNNIFTRWSNQPRIALVRFSTTTLDLPSSQRHLRPQVCEEAFVENRSSNRYFCCFHHFNLPTRSKPTYIISRFTPPVGRPHWALHCLCSNRRGYRQAWQVTCFHWYYHKQSKCIAKDCFCTYITICTVHVRL